MQEVRTFPVCTASVLLYQTSSHFTCPVLTLYACVIFVASQCLHPAPCSAHLSTEITRASVNLMWISTKLGLPDWTESYLLEFQNFGFWFDSCFRHYFRSHVWKKKQKSIFSSWLEAVFRAMWCDHLWEYFSSAVMLDHPLTCAREQQLQFLLLCVVLENTSQCDRYREGKVHSLCGLYIC